MFDFTFVFRVRLGWDACYRAVGFANFNPNFNSVVAVSKWWLKVGSLTRCEQ